MTARPHPALYEERRDQPMKVIPLSPTESLLGWLESSGRLQSNEINEFQANKITGELDEILDPELYSLDDEDEQEDLDD